MHLTITMFSDLEFFKNFGKQGTENDLLIRNQSDSGNVITYVAPNSDKIQTLLQAAAMADYPVVVVNELTQATGEILILLNELSFEKGLIVTDFLEDNIKSLIKDMSIASFDFVKKYEASVREKIMSIRMERKTEPVIVPVDNYFPVKGVGTVVLGLVKSGTVKQYDKLAVYPTKKEVLVKSMQSQDKDVKETEPGQRIGLALKGVESDELKRGYVFSDKDVRCEKNITIEATKSKYSKYEFAAGKRLMINIGLQVISGTIKNVNGNNLDIELESPMAIYEDRCVLVTTDSMPRVIGNGKVL